MNHLVVQVPCDQDDTILLSVDVVRSRFLDNFVILFILIQKQSSFIYWKKKILPQLKQNWKPSCFARR